MDAFLGWVRENWFGIVQSAGIVGSLCVAALAFRRDTRSRRIGDVLTLTQQHRELWGELHRRPELSRVLSPKVDLVRTPISLMEQEFVNLVVVHFHTGWLLIRDGVLVTGEAITRDVASFFALPLPQAVWRETKALREKRFVAFVEGCLAGSDRPKAG